MYIRLGKQRRYRSRRVWYTKHVWNTLRLNESSRTKFLTEPEERKTFMKGMPHSYKMLISAAAIKDSLPPTSERAAANMILGTMGLQLN